MPLLATFLIQLSVYLLLNFKLLTNEQAIALSLICQGLVTQKAVTMQPPVKKMKKQRHAYEQLLALLAVGCLVPFSTACVASGSFEEAQSQQSIAASQAEGPSKYCQRIDSGHRTWGMVSKGSMFLAGGSGIATVPVQNDDQELALAATTAGMATLAVISTFASEDFAEDWARDCSGGGR